MESEHKIWEIFKAIADKSSDGEYVFRGQARAEWEIQSTLYRMLKEFGDDVDPEGIGIDNIDKVQNDIKKKGQEYTDLPEGQILPNIQHYGGQTNLIDFTSDSHIALFFACDGYFSEPGAVFLLQKDNIKVYDTKSPLNRVVSQKGIFVQPDGGVLDPDKTVIIPANLKQAILDYLRRCHSIYPQALYNDLHGYLKYSEIHCESDKDLYKGWILPSVNEHSQMALYDSAIEKNPNSYRAFYARSRARKNAGDSQGAESDLTEAIKIRPRFAEYYYARSLIRYKAGDSQGAKSDLTEAIEIRYHARYYYARAFVSHKAGDWQEAESDLTKAITIRPDSDMYYYARSRVREDKGDLQGSESDRTKAIKINPKSDRHYYTRSLIRKKAGDLQGVESDLTEAITIRPDSDMYYYARSLIRQDKGDLSGAESDLTEAIKIRPHFAEYYHVRSLVRKKAGDSQGAKSDLEEFQKHDI